MIFTAQHVPRQQTASREFKSYGASNMAPAPVTNARVFGFPKDSLTSKTAMYWRCYLSAFINKFSDGSEYVLDPLNIQDSSFAKSNEESDFLFQIPIGVVTVERPSEGTVKSLKALGFSRSSSGRYSFFQGACTPTSIVKATKLGGDMFSYAPSERVSLGGAMALFILRRLIYATYKIQHNLHSSKVIAEELAKPNIAAGVPKTFKVSQIEDNHRGHFLAYFDGLILPDRNIIHTIIDIYSPHLGKTESDREGTFKLLTRGWSSVSNTTAGKIVSHMVFCINLARQGGFSVIPTFHGGDYQGTLLIGYSHLFYNGINTLPAEGEVLRKEVTSMHSHTSALEQILEIAEGAPLRTTKLPRPIDQAMVTTARSLHYILADRKITPEMQVLINGLLPNLRFRQTFLKALDPAHILMALESLTSKTRLDVEAPFDLASGNVYTHSLTHSTLSAFGVIAPSPMMSQSANVTLPVTKNILKGTSQGSLEGIPIFGKPLQQSVEDWKTLKKTGMVNFRTKGKNAFGQMRISDIGRFLKDTDEEGRQAQKLIIKYASRADKKRKSRDDDEDAEEWTGFTVHADERKKKKSRVESEAQAIFAGFGWEEADEMEL